MKHLKTNWQFEVLQPGFLVISAFLLVDISFLVYQCKKQDAKLTCYLIALYLVILLLRKYRNLAYFAGLLTIIFLINISVSSQQNNLPFSDNSVIMLYPDDIKVNEDWMSAEGKLDGKNMLISAKLTEKQRELLKLGKTVILTNLRGEISPIESATNYGQFDAEKYYASKNIWQKVTLSACTIKVKRTGLIDFLHHIRFQLQKYFKRMPQVLGFFSSELILGENPDPANQFILNNYRDLGIIHIISISGLHVGIYTIVIATICSLFKMTEKESFVCCLLFLLNGIFLSKGQAGFIRASLTYALKQMFSFQKTPIAKYDLLGLACLIHIFLVPRLMMGVGALLSYVLALGLEMTDKMSNLNQSLALNILLLPLLLFYFFQFNFLTVVFNLLAVPYFNWLVMPLTFFNLATFGGLPEISICLESILRLAEKAIGQISATKLGLLTFGKITWWQCLLLLCLTSGIIVCLNDKVLTKKLVVSTVIFYGLIFCSIHFPMTGQVSLIDVGQGDSILITTPFPRRVYLIDVGGKLSFGRKKITPQVNKITIPMLKAMGISHIDGIFVTHQDADHVGDLGPLLSQVEVHKLYMAAGLINNPSFAKRISGHLKKDQIIQLLAGDEVVEPKITFDVVYPFAPGLGKNEDSLCLTFKIKNKRWLFTGDLGQTGEKEIMAKYHLKANYFKLGHHGSRTASNFTFLKKLAPEMTFISAGRNNRFNHPHQETLSTLQKLQIPSMSTQTCGMITWTYGLRNNSSFSSFLPIKANSKNQR